MSKLLLLATSCLLLFTVSSWQIADDYQVKFSGSGASGTFSELAGELIFDPDNLATAKMDVSVQVATIDTGNDTKDRHARGDSWFDAEQYPEIRFRATDFSRQASGYLAKGQLTLHGTTKPVSIPFSFTETGAGGLFEGSFELNRKDYGIKGNSFGFLVGKTFTVDLKVPVRK